MKSEKVKRLKLQAKKFIIYRNREIQRKLDELRGKTAVKEIAGIWSSLRQLERSIPETGKKWVIGSPDTETAVKARSRGAAEQRAMFAKMGASGSLQAKGPSGKRTGAKIGGDVVSIWEGQGVFEPKKRHIEHAKNMAKVIKGDERKKLIDRTRNPIQRNREKIESLQNQYDNIVKSTRENNLSGKSNTRNNARLKRIQAEIDGIINDIQEDLAIQSIIKPPRAPRSNFFDRFSKKHHTPNAFTVYKDSHGRPRWVTISSNAFRDKDGEIVSTKALTTAVNKADRLYKTLLQKGVTKEQANLKARGPLRWWHVPGLELGICDFQMVNGRMLIESGYFNSESIAQKMAKAKGLNVSIGFRHPRTEPDKKGIFNNITIFERSPTPSGKAANNFTSLITTKGDKMNQEKIKALRLLLGDEAAQLLESARRTEKEAIAAVGDVYGESYKEDTTAAPTINELMEVWNAYKEAERVVDDSAENWDDLLDDYYIEEEEPEEATKADGMEELKAAMYKMSDKLDALIKMMGPKGEEEKKKEDATAARIAQLEAELTDLKSDQPRAMKGYRATMQGETVENLDPADFDSQRQKALEQMGPAGQLYDAAAKLTSNLFSQ